MTVATLPEHRIVPAPTLKLVSTVPAVRILHVVPSLYGGGMERALVRLLDGFTERRARGDRDYPTIHGLCVMQDGDDQLIGRCCSLVATWVLGAGADGKGAQTPRLYPRRHWLWRGLRSVIRTFEPDIVHARTTGVWMDGVLGTLGRSSAKLVLGFHGRTTLEPVSRWRQMLHRIAAARARAILAVSRDSLSMMHDDWHLPAEHQHCIPNGVDTARFRPAASDEERRMIRARIGVAPDASVAICVANLLPIKAIDQLIETWRKVAMTDRSAHLLIAGQGPLRNNLETLTRALRCADRVTFLGRREDVPELLRASDVFVLPSRYEASNNATLEAMASGLPAVAFDVGGMREIIEPQRTGWLVPPGDAGLFAETLIRVLFDRTARERVGQAAREWVVQEHSLDDWVERYATFYHEIAGQ